MTLYPCLATCQGESVVLVVKNLVISFPTLLMPAFLAFHLHPRDCQGERVVLTVNNLIVSLPILLMPAFLPLCLYSHACQGQHVLVVSKLTLLCAYLPVFLPL